MRADSASVFLGQESHAINLQMGRSALKVLKTTGPLGVALGAAGLCYSDAVMDEGTRRALSMYAAFGTHNWP